MKHNKLILWISAAFIGISAAVFSPGMTASADPSGVTTSGLKYTCNEATLEATIIGLQDGASYDVNIPSKIGEYTVTVIGDRAFSEIPITSLSIPGTVKKIENFALCKTALKEVSIPATVEELTYGAFFYCRDLTTVRINGATKVDGKTFEGCSALKNVTLSNQIPYIDSEAFRDCTALETITIPGKTELRYHVFENCENLKSVYLSDASYTTKSWYNSYAFYNCPKLFQVNGMNALIYKIDSNGMPYPTINPSIKTALNNHFRRSMKVGFVDRYCDDLCAYIVETETSYWMNDALKARQLHDWLVRHCMREDGANGESNGDIENQIASSVFLSYAINERGEGIGESICAGLSKAYTMLLAKANVESYFISNSNHAWNLVKIGDKYYHTDLLADVNYYHFGFFTPKDDCCTCYKYFLKSTMASDTSIKQSFLDEHPLLMKYKNNISDKIKNCNENYLDNNNDGILDYDFDLSGQNMWYADFLHDTYALYYMQSYVYVGGTMDQINDKLAETLYFWHYQMHDSFQRFIFNYYGWQE